MSSNGRAPLLQVLLNGMKPQNRQAVRERIPPPLYRALKRTRTVARRVIPAPIRQGAGLLVFGTRLRPPTGWAHLGSLRRTDPVSDCFGLDRGTPVDRHYIAEFLGAHRADIRGRVLEVAEPGYTWEFGGDRVERSDVLHVEQGHPGATLIGDLATGEGIPEAAFDCIILTQVIHLIWDMEAAIETTFRALAPGGVVLMTGPGIAQISRDDANRWGDYWRFTSLSIRRLFAEVFSEQNVEVSIYGNALSATAFIQGIAAEELRPGELAARHLDYEVLLGVRAVRTLD